MSEPVYTSRGATFDLERVYRYSLWREWDPSLRGVLFLMLNPSTADETQVDPTLRRCLGYAQRRGFGSFAVANLSALRSTDPRVLKMAADPVGPGNDAALVEFAHRSALVVCGWARTGRSAGATTSSPSCSPA